MPAQTNARVRTVSAQGSTDDFNDPGTADATVSNAAVPAYYEEKRDRRRGPEGGSDVIVWRSLTLDDRVHVDFQTGQEVSWEYRGATLTGVIAAVERSDLATIPAHMREVRLTLEPV